jgi:Cu2+-exporting ATPase
MIKNEKYDVTGMSCAACSAHINKAVSQVEGVKEVNVNLLTNSMTVSYEDSATPEIICKAVEDAGYGAKLVSSDGTVKKEKERFQDHETPILLRRLIVSLILLVPLFYFSFGYMNPSFGWPLGIIGEYPLAFGTLSLVLSLGIIIANRKFFVSGVKALIHRSPNMDTLVALGSGVAFVNGLVLFGMMIFNTLSGGISEEALMQLAMGLTFETAGMIPTLITIGKTLESYSKGKTTNAIKSLIDLAPKTANVIRDGVEVTIAAEDMVTGDIFVVRPGESFSADGVVVEGESAVNEAALTGESLPVDKVEGDAVSAATINLNGLLKCRATRVGQDMTLYRIVDLVQSASGTKTKISRIADKVSAIFVPTIIVIAIAAFGIWLAAGLAYGMFPEGSNAIAYSISRAISVLVVACPCALGLATPVAIMVGNGKGAKNGVLFKTASSLEESGKVAFVVLDKTGTLTKGSPMVTDIVPREGVDEETLLGLAISLEASSEHPLAKAIVERGQNVSVLKKKVTGFKALPGHGVYGVIDGEEVYGSHAALMEEKGFITSKERAIGDALADQGKTPIYFAKGGQYLGIIAVADVLKEDSKEAIEEFKELGVTPVMLTGDNYRTAKAVASQLGLTYYVSDVLPGQKMDVVKKLQDLGRVMMVGDGINDAPALTQSDIGVAIGAGSDIAIESADVVLMKSSLRDAAMAIRLSRYTLRNIKENLFWAFFYNLLMIPIAAGAFYPTGVPWLMNLKPWYGAAAMALSSVFVVLNALRINLFPAYRRGKGQNTEEFAIPESFFGDRTINERKENQRMEKTLEIKGMMCQHCVAHVKKALEGVSGVSKVEVSLENKNAVIEASVTVADEALKAAVSEAGYEVTAIK